MNKTHSRFGVRDSALGWLRRLGWNPLDERTLATLRGEHHSALLEKRLLPWLRRYRYELDGERGALSPTSIDRIIAEADTCCHSLDGVASSSLVHRLLLEGIRTELAFPDGRRRVIQVPLIDWEHVHRNHWDVADAPALPDPSGSHVRELVGYVNGIPLVVLACVERDRNKRWGSVGDGIQHLRRGMESASYSPLPLHAQLLLSLDRRGGRYAAVGTPQHAWMKWREQGWSRAAQDQLRDSAMPFAEVPLDPPWSSHAELLHGVLSPPRLLDLIRHFLCDARQGQRYVVRPNQFFAVQSALQALRTRDASGRRGGGQLCLAAGSGLQRARQWLLRALRTDAALRSIRVLQPLTRMTPPPEDRRQRPGPLPADQLSEFLAGRASSPHEVPLRILRGWARKAKPPTADDDAATGDDVMLLVDADFWESDPALLRKLRRCLPRAVWLTLVAAPVTAASADLDPGVMLYQYPPAHAVADGVVVPAWRDTGPSPIGDSPSRRVAQVATAISQHFHELVRLAERGLRAMLLVDTTHQAHGYQRALAVDARLKTHVAGYDNRGLPTDRASERIPPQVELVIVHGELPAAQDARAAVLYVDRALTASERLRGVGLINAPHPDKRTAMLVDFHTGDIPAAAPPEWLPLPVQDNHPVLGVQRQRLHSLLPTDAEEDFHACRDHLAPDWEVGPQGDDIDLHRHRRDLLHRRVTAFGQRLQLAISAETALTGQPSLLGGQYRALLHRFSLLRDAVSRLALEAGRFNAEDRRVRHWAREQAPQVCEQHIDYQVLRTLEPVELSAAQHANHLYTRLRHRLDETGLDPDAVERSRTTLRQVLVECGDAQERIAALQALEPTLRGSPQAGDAAQAVSRGLLVLGSLFDTTLDEDVYVRLGSRIDALVADEQRQPLHLFDAYVRDRLEATLRGHLEDSQLEAVVHAVLLTGPHWPPG
ncbi:type I restriction endonuclease subunit R [Stenotrophomonas sp. ISL-67]|uniref:type I restriction endonuclease n=1 Tax=Stenotrophomonas sp. ISL-67 TaxID=2819171 RepID=UPI001BE7088A|nr:type I restriction endonuclease [Stenotrophomonas sp. ISL-67]MBT2767144.1 type I restriction endonuclease subunit R [Stenotrophomonas sp. ISL-67]